MSIKLSAVSASQWSGSGTITICNNDYYLTFTREGCDGPCLTLTSTGSGGGSYTCVRSGCGVNFADFAIGDELVCTGTVGCGGPAANTALIHVTWAHCEYDGEGWYCVRACGTADDCEARELADADAGDPGIEICSGPYASEEEADLVCGSTPIPPGTSCAAGGAFALGDTLFGDTSGDCAGGGAGCFWHGSVTSGSTYHITWITTGSAGAFIGRVTVINYNTPDCTGGTTADMFDSDDIGGLGFGGCASFVATYTGCLCVVLRGLTGIETISMNVTTGACP